MPLSVDRRGDELIAIYPDASLEDAAKLFDDPLIFSVVIARHESKILFVYNARRQEWELPAGLIEPAETPEATAHRELNEESHQSAALHYAGLCVLRLAHSGQLEPGAMYVGDIETVQPFASADGETTRLLFWDLQSDTDEYINENGRKIAELMTT